MIEEYPASTDNALLADYTVILFLKKEKHNFDFRKLLVE
jgi:hypothetical protein